MRGIMFKLWLTIVLTNILVFAILGVALGKLVHDFHFNLKAEDLRMLGNEINIVYGNSGKEEALNYAKAMSKHTSSTIAIVNNSGKILVTTDEKIFNSKKVFSSHEANALHSNKHNVSVGENPAFGKEMISVVVPSYSKNFSTIVFTPVDPITSTIDQLWKLMFYTGLSIMLIMALISYIISRRITSPLLTLNKEALKIAESKFDLQVPTSNDEIGQLGKSLQYAASSVQKTIEEREKIYNIQKDFLANVSHDLRTPLSLIQGYAIALQQNVVTGNEKDNAVEIIIEESQRMQRLTNELLDLARLEGEQTLQLVPIDFIEMVEYLVNIYQPIAAEKDITIFSKLTAINQDIYADSDRITQVIVNFLDNAIKYTPSKGTITVELSRKKDHVILKVHNTGSFIPEEDLDLLWERFYKTEKSRTLSIKGAGLGLAIVKEIILAHKGKVGVTSNIQTGTTFWFELPMHNA